MDAYEEKENLISSDEYSNEEDDDDALVNDAVRSLNKNLRADNFGVKKNFSNWKIDHKQKQISSLLRRNKIFVIYKNKSIKWLNSKNQREKYRKYLHQIARETQISYPSSVSFKQTQQMNERENNSEVYIQNIVCAKREEDHFNINLNKEKIMEERSAFKNTSSPIIINNVKNVLQEKNMVDFAENNTVNLEGNLTEKIKPQENVQEVQHMSRKRSRSNSSIILNETNSVREKCNENLINSETQKLYEGINEMFPNFDKIINNHVNYITNTSLPIVNDKLKHLSNEINSLNEIIEAKEMEINRLSHLKMVKEEIYFRLCKKKNNLQTKECFTDKQRYSLEELKEIIPFLSVNKYNIEKSNSPETIQKLIESRANMNSDDLKREKSNTSRLHSILVSQNMLNDTDFLESALSRKIKRLDLTTTYQCTEKNNHMAEEKRLNLRRHGKVRDVKSLIADFRNRHPDSSAHVSKQAKSTEFNIVQSHSVPLFGKKSIPQLSNNNKLQLFSLPGTVKDISSPPVNRSNKIPSSFGNVRLEDNQFINKNKGHRNGVYTTNNEYPLCQECKRKESRFVCAGCGNQWYCSKNCQITAWDKHCDLCME